MSSSTILALAARLRLRAWEKYGDPKDHGNPKQAVSAAIFEVAAVMDDYWAELENSADDAAAREQK